MTEAAYREGYRYLRGVIDSLDPDDLAAACPHCPEWSLKGVLIHLMAVAEQGKGLDVPANFRQRVYDSIVNADDQDQADAARLRDDSWNQAVESMSDLTLDEIWQRWHTAQQQEPGPWAAIVDFAVHVGDIEEAIGASASRELDLHGKSLQRYVWLTNEQLKVRGLPTVRVEMTDAAITAGDADSDSTVRGTSYELLRIFTGRRTIEEADAHVEWDQVTPEMKRFLPVYGWLTESRQHQRITSL